MVRPRSGDRGRGETVTSIERALLLVERIYEAAVRPDAWHDFLAELSEALGGVAVQLSLRLPHVEPTPDNFFRLGLDDSYHAVFVKHVIEGLPWGSLRDEVFRGRFGVAGEALSYEVEDSPFYREYMQPNGLAPDWPICHVIESHGAAPLAGIVIYRREGGRPLEAEDFTLLDSLVPHLARAYAIHAQLATARHECTALTEVIDRLPVGVLLVDTSARVTLANRSVEKILTLGDGFRLERGRPCASDPRENRALQGLLAAAARASGVDPTGGVLSISRPSGRRSFSVWVGSLLAAAPENSTGEATAILFIADTEAGEVSTTEVLQHLYQLTRAEADLVRLISSGQSLEQVAEARGVTMNTVRSQLKQVFCKTDTKRQGELVHLVLTGIAAMRTDAGDLDAAAR
jgi:DNA-binding CsgD family transcriptional regulator/PAS domain-containing protein